MLVVLGFALLMLAYAFWSFLGLVGGLPLFGAVLLAEAALFGVLAAWRRPSPAAFRALAGACAALELGGLLLVPLTPLGLAYNLLVVAGLALVAWRGALSPGAPVALAGFALMLASNLLSAETFLLPGFALGAAGWGALAWAALRSGAAHASGASAAASHAGGRP